MVKCYKENYFRPQFVRDKWIDLSGKWDFVFDDKNVGEAEQYYLRFPEKFLNIAVPYSYETPASGIGDESVHERVWYRRVFSAAKPRKDRRYLLNFEGADYETKVWVNGIFVGEHKGGNCRFTFDITDNLSEDGNNTLAVSCADSLDSRQPRGKQRWLKDSFGCWYVQTTGIWKPVWLEEVSATRLDRVKITPDIDGEKVRVGYEFAGGIEGTEVDTEITFDDIPVVKNRASVTKREFFAEFDMRCDAFDFKVKQWHPLHPNLYDITFTLYKDGHIVDKVGSYFGMRKIEADEKGIRLNNSPLYQKLVLAQNYWKESGYTMPDESAACTDIAYIKKAGFNGLRIHQKVEDERFLFRCDLEGLLVWAEAPSAYEFGDVAVQKFADEWSDAVRQQYNHPSIVAWVPFNESWGLPGIFTERRQQEFTRGIYSLTKAYDDMRPVITNDGWEHTCSDIITLHDYDGKGANMSKRYENDLRDILSNRVAHGCFKFAFAKGYEYRGQPIIVSEYGGVALEGSDGWGYNGKARDKTAMLAAIDDLTSTIKAMSNVCGYCYTQLTDVYQEVNGLLDANHNPKVDLEKIRQINDK